MSDLKKWRVKEVEGKFYVQRKYWCGWSNYYRATPGGCDYFLTLHQATEHIEQLDKDRTIVYHYPNKDRWQTKPPSDVKPVVSPAPSMPSKRA